MDLLGMHIGLPSISGWDIVEGGAALLGGALGGPVGAAVFAGGVKMLSVESAGGSLTQAVKEGAIEGVGTVLAGGVLGKLGKLVGAAAQDDSPFLVKLLKGLKLGEEDGAGPAGSNAPGGGGTPAPPDPNSPPDPRTSGPRHAAPKEGRLGKLGGGALGDYVKLNPSVFGRGFAATLTSSLLNMYTQPTTLPTRPAGQRAGFQTDPALGIGMPVLMVPDKESGSWPRGSRFEINSSVEDWLDGSVESQQGLNWVLMEFWDSLGTADAADPSTANSQVNPSVPDGALPSIVASGKSELFATYDEAVNNLRYAFQSLLQADFHVKSQTGDALTKELSNARDVIGNQVVQLGEDSAKAPDYPKSENQYILEVVDSCVGAATDAIDAVNADIEQRATVINGQADKIDTIAPAIKASPVLGGPASTGPGSTAGQVEPWDSSNPFQPPNIPQGPVDQSNVPSPSDSSNPVQQAVDDLKNALSPGNSLDSNSNAPSSPFGSMTDPFGSPMLPLMLDQLSQRSQVDPGLSRQDQLEPSAYSAPTSQPRVAAPALSPSPGIDTATGPRAATPAASTSQPSGTPGPDGLRLYTFPDHRTQLVTPGVWQRLNNAFSVSAGDVVSTQEADGKPSGDPVGPSDLRTGMDAVWDNCSGIIVVWPENGGTLDVIVGGKMQPFPGQGTDPGNPPVQAAQVSDGGDQQPASSGNSDSADTFGQFIGFFRPPGIDFGSAGGDAAAGPVGALPGDQSVALPGADIVAAPAT